MSECCEPPANVQTADFALRAKRVAMLPDPEPRRSPSGTASRMFLRHYHCSSFVQSFLFSQPINNVDVRQDAVQRIFARRADVFTSQRQFRPRAARTAGRRTARYG